MSPASCDMLYACPVIALLSCVSCVCLCYCVCLFKELSAALCLTCFKCYPACSFNATSVASPKNWVSDVD